MSNILIVDDSPTLVHLVAHILSGKGHQVSTARNGDDALKMAAQERPDLILLDIILPRMNGYEVCRQLKSGAQTEDIPIVMLTSKSKDKDRKWGMRQGADGYISKPVDEDELLEAVEKLIPQAAVEKQQAVNGKQK